MGNRLVPFLSPQLIAIIREHAGNTSQRSWNGTRKSRLTEHTSWLMANSKVFSITLNFNVDAGHLFHCQWPQKLSSNSSGYRWLRNKGKSWCSLCSTLDFLSIIMSTEEKTNLVEQHGKSPSWAAPARVRKVFWRKTALKLFVVLSQRKLCLFFCDVQPLIYLVSVLDCTICSIPAGSGGNHEITAQAGGQRSAPFSEVIRIPTASQNRGLWSSPKRIFFLVFQNPISN